MDDFALSLDVGRRLVRVLVRGDLSTDEGKAIITRARTEAAAHGYNLLYDIREARVRARPTDWFHLPRQLSVLKGRTTRFVRAAVLITPGVQEEDYRFYEEVTANVGLQLRVFYDEEAALAWLAEPT